MTKLTSVGLALMVALGTAYGCGGDDDPGEPPAAAVLTSPIADDEVRSPFTVQGTGEPGAQVSVTLWAGTQPLTNEGGEVDEQGSFSVELTYADQSIGSALELTVTLGNAHGASPETTLDLVQAGLGNTYATAAEAPSYQGTNYADLQIYDVAREVYLDDTALLEALDDDQVVYFGEQHETAPIHELQLWLLSALTERHDGVALAMEHFQADEQGVIDDYLAGTITDSQFLAGSDPWPNFTQYWMPLVNHMKGLDLPVVATNVADEALQTIYANGLTSPLAFVNSWGPASPYNDYLPPRPLPAWTSQYQDYFETGFDYATHGQGWGLTYQEALDYFTDLAVLRDHTMGYWIASHVQDTGDRVLFVGGDWHVQTGIATPDLANAWSPAELTQSLVTTTPRASFEQLRTADFDGRPYADYILIYD